MPVFELPSAKNLSVAKAVETFVPTPLYWRTLGSDEHTIVYGTRGSGKTFLLKMMAIDHLAAFAKINAQARSALHESRRLGLFLPLGIDWCVAYQSDSPNGMRLFRDGLNLSAADCLLEGVETLLSRGVIPGLDNTIVEAALARDLSELWFRPLARQVGSFATLRRQLLMHQAILGDLWRDGRSPEPTDEQAAGYSFRAGELLAPLRNAIRLVNERLSLPVHHRWVLCLDELEDLHHGQLKEILTVLRANVRELTIKITTQPYTIETTLTGFAPHATAVDFRDYQVERLQYDPHDQAYIDLAGEILKRRVEDKTRTGEAIAIELFGQSTFADRAATGDAEFGALKDRLLAASGGRDSGRKKVPVAAIRSLKRQAEGNRRSEAYSGWSTIIAMSDGNPGMFVRLLNELRVGPATTRIDAMTQHDVVRTLAELWHEWSQALYQEWAFLHRFIQSLGEEFSSRLHSRRDRDDDLQEEVNRCVVDLTVVADRYAEALRVGARHSLLIAESMGGGVSYPHEKGLWRLSYALAPKFWLLTRRGRAVQLIEGQLSLFADNLSSEVQFGPPVDDVGALGATEKI